MEVMANNEVFFRPIHSSFGMAKMNKEFFDAFERRGEEKQVQESQRRIQGLSNEMRANKSISLVGTVLKNVFRALGSMEDVFLQGPYWKERLNSIEVLERAFYILLGKENEYNAIFDKKEFDCFVLQTNEVIQNIKRVRKANDEWRENRRKELGLLNSF